MAIVIREERNNSGWFSFGLIFIVVTIVGVAAYYLFFIQPELIDTAVVPLKLQTVDDIRSLKFSPQEVLNSSFFTSPKQNIPPPTISQGGNPRPFGIQ